MKQDLTGGYCPRCDTVWASPGICRCDPLKISQDEMNNAVETYRIVGIDKAMVGSIMRCEICNDPKPDPKAEWRCLNCAGKLFYIHEQSQKFDSSDLNLGQTKKGYAVPADSVYTKEVWNAAIEAAAALLEMDDEILPYTIEQIRKLKK